MGLILYSSRFLLWVVLYDHVKDFIWFSVVNVLSTFGHIFWVLYMGQGRNFDWTVIKAHAFIWVFLKEIVQIYDICGLSTICKLICFFYLINISVVNTQHGRSILVKVLGNHRVYSWMINVGRNVLLVFIVYHLLFLEDLIFGTWIFGLEVYSRFEFVNLVKRWTFVKFNGASFVERLMEVLELLDAMLKVFNDCAKVGFINLKIWATSFFGLDLIQVWLFGDMLRKSFVEEGIFWFDHW